LLVLLLAESLRVARHDDVTRNFEKQLMYFALMIVIALAAAALVLLLEHRGQATLLEREDGARAKISENTPRK
jgi:hypothetical protein